MPPIRRMIDLAAQARKIDIVECMAWPTGTIMPIGLSGHQVNRYRRTLITLNSTIPDPTNAYRSGFITGTSLIRLTKAS